MIIKDVRLTFMHLEKPRAAAEGATPKYSATLIIPKSSKQLAEIKEAILVAKNEKFGASAKGLKNPLHDGDAVDEDGERIRGPEFTDAFYITATSIDKVELIAGKDKGPATTEHLKWGNYGCAKVVFKGYDKAGNKGVAAYLNGLWITKRGELLGGGSDPWSDDIEAEDFGAIAEQARAAGKQDGEFF